MPLARLAVSIMVAVRCAVPAAAQPAAAARDVAARVARSPCAAPAYVGLASWYGGGEPLNPFTASGSPFNPESMEAAMWNVPFGSRMRITNLDSGRSIVVRVTDRGPNRRFRGRVIDLTRSAFARLAPLDEGLIRVVVEPLPTAAPSASSG